MPWAVAAVILLGVTGVVAATNSSFAQMLGRVNPFYKDYVRPVEMSVIDKGIKMEVVAVGVYDDELKAYITLEDLEGGRFSETTEFGIGILGDDDAFFGGDWKRWEHEDINYDFSSGIWTSLVQGNISNLGKSRRVTFGVSNIRYNPRSYSAYSGDDYNYYFDISAVSRNPETVKIKRDNLRRSSGIDTSSADFEVTVLKPGGVVYAFPGIDFMNISNIGFIGGKLHVQIWSEQATDRDGYITLFDGEGKPVSSYTRREEFDFEVGGRIFREIVFDTIDEDARYRLSGNFVIWDELAIDLKVELDIDDYISKDIIEIEERVEIDGFIIEKITITPFGIKLTSDEGYRPQVIDFREPPYTFDIKLYGDEEIDVKWQPSEEERAAGWVPERFEWEVGRLIRMGGVDNGIYINRRVSPIDIRGVRAIGINGRVVQLVADG